MGRWCARNINPDPHAFGHKDALYQLLAGTGHSNRLPRLFGIIDNGVFDDDDPLHDCLNREGRLVIKDVDSATGDDVYFAEATAGGSTIFGKHHTISDLDTLFAHVDRAIVTEYCEQAPYLDALWPDSVNTLRVLTINPEEGDAFIPAAAQRIGTAQTGRLDNFSAGGLSAAVALDTGTLSPGGAPDEHNHVRWYDTHPDTSTRITGTTIPRWETLTAELLDLVETLPELKYVGWDIIVTAPGEFAIIEANSYPNPDVLQIHDPLLANSDVRSFFHNKFK